MNSYKIMAVFIGTAFLCHPVACTFSKGLYWSLFPDVSYLRKHHKSMLEQETLLAFTHAVLQIWIWFCFAWLVAHTQPLAQVPVPSSSPRYPVYCTKNIFMALAKKCFWLLSKLGDCWATPFRRITNAGKELFFYHKTEQLMSQTSSNYSLVILERALPWKKKEPVWNCKLDFNQGLCATRPALHLVCDPETSAEGLCELHIASCWESGS